MRGAKTVEEYIESAANFGSELELLRSILLETELEETVKWGIPCYMHGGKNLIGLAGFQKHFALWFYNGVAMPDPDGVLVNASEGVTKALRHWKFTKRPEVSKAKVLVYVRDAIQAGPPPGPVRGTGKVQVPAELQEALLATSGAQAAFEQLTPAKQREYAEHVASAKRESTRHSRAEKAVPQILKGQGLHDKYRNS